MSTIDIWIVAVGVILWLGSIALGYMTKREQERAWREFLDRGRHPSLWRKEIDGGS